MCRMVVISPLALTVLAGLGCQTNPFLTPQQQAELSQQQSVAQDQDYKQRLSRLDADNQDLQSQLARAQQSNQRLGEQVTLLRKQLADTAELASQLEDAKRQADEKVGGLLASSRRRGGATIRANSSWDKELASIKIEGIESRRDGDVIRIELPSDRLFRQGSAQFRGGGIQLLDQVASAIQRSYPNQHLGIEAHLDNSGTAAGTSGHQVTASQAQAVFRQLTQRNRIPAERLMVVAHGSNHPLASNATPAGRAKNRRVELVVYPSAAK